MWISRSVRGAATQRRVVPQAMFGEQRQKFGAASIGDLDHDAGLLGEQVRDGG